MTISPEAEFGFLGGHRVACCCLLWVDWAAVVGAVVTEDHGYTPWSFGTCFTRGSCDRGGG